MSTTGLWDIDQVSYIGIYPPIGIARVGNSVDADGWYYAPEVPGRFDEPQGGFKDADGAVKRQAARFRVYAFGEKGRVLCEANEANGFKLDWSVNVVNQKAAWYTFMGRQQEGAFEPGYTTLRNPLVQPDAAPKDRDRLIVDSGVKSVCGTGADPVPLAGKFYGSNKEPTNIYLGEARTDDQGRLVVLAGRGLSFSVAKKNQPFPLIMNDFDSPNWIDDTCDGWVNVEVTHRTGKKFVPQRRARVIGTTPKFANGIYAPTTLYDVMEEVYEQGKRAKAGDKYDVGEVGWYRHIWPLLQRPALLSWVNGQANGGHGPNGPGNFFDEKWQETLSDNSSESEPIRKGVLGRMRLPETNGKYDQARVGQAYPYFMPWLSGDNGRTTAGDPSTFTSVTELQYDRLVKWSKGDFIKKTTPFIPPPPDIDNIRLFRRPAALTKAALEATIGAPLYPGIEMSWNAELAETYDLSSPFTINENVQPGDLTKFLSLPWQSDFYMCRSYWWPSARPDAIVTEREYNLVSKSVISSEIAKRLNRRVPWERGLHQNYTDVYGDQPLFANTDMVQNWHRLGFIVERPSEGPVPIFVETQRGVIHRGEQGVLSGLRATVPVPSSESALLQKSKLNAAPVTAIPHGGGIVLPQPSSGNQPIDTVKSLQKHLQIAMAIELATIPLYLFGMYTVKTPDAYARDPRYVDPVVSAIRGVVAEEMLHLSLAGNILLAVRGTPKLYDPKYIPSYKMLMPGRVPDLWLQLRKLTRENLQTFIDVETPEAAGAQPEPDKYHTIGQFYAAIRQGLEYLNGTVKDLFDPETAPYQFAPGLGYQAKIRDAGGSVIVTDLESAELAIQYIVTQGEGNPGPYDDPDKLEKDHYDVFLDLQKGKHSWEAYPVRENPTTMGYLNDDKDRRIYQVSLAFDAAYCFLLLTIEKLWTIETSDRRHNLVLGNMFGLMMGVLAPLAKFLVQQKIGHEGEHAAPCFGYYKFRSGASALQQVQEEIQAAIDSYVGVTAETADQVSVHDYGAMLEALLPIQSSINTLLDLDTFEKREILSLVKPQQPGVQSHGAKGFARGL